MRHFSLKAPAREKLVLKMRNRRNDDPQGDQGGKAPSQPIGRASSAPWLTIPPYFGHQNAERNHGRQKVTRKFGSRNREEDENDTCPAQQEKHWGALLVPEIPPLLDSMNGGVKQEEAPGQEAGKIDDEIVIDGTGAVRVSCGESLQALLPKGVSRKIRVPKRNQDKPGERDGEERRQAQQPVQVFEAGEFSAKGLVGGDG